MKLNDEELKSKIIEILFDYSVERENGIGWVNDMILLEDNFDYVSKRIMEVIKQTELK